jgi:hypothetical protein
VNFLVAILLAKTIVKIEAKISGALRQSVLTAVAVAA